MRVPTSQGVWEIHSQVVVGTPHFPEREQDFRSSSVHGCHRSCTWPGPLSSLGREARQCLCFPHGFVQHPKPCVYYSVHKYCVNIFIWNLAPGKCVNGSGLCSSWDPNLLLSQFGENQAYGLNNSLFQSHKPTAFIPIALGDSSTLIPLVSTFKTQRSPG